MAIQPRTSASCWVFIVAFVIATVVLLRGALAANADDFDAVVRTLQQDAGSSMPADPAFKFPATINPDDDLLSQLQTIFGRYFSKQVNLAPLLRRIIIESAVREIPDAARILYNPSRQLFFYLPDAPQQNNQIKIATLSSIDQILGKAPPPDSPLAGYTRGFEDFNALAQLMSEPNSRDTLQVIWMDSPRSEDDKKRIQLLLLDPMRRSLGMSAQPASCKRAVDHYVDDLRAGRDASIPLLPRLTAMVRPSNYFQNKDRIFLVLSEALIARYYVFAEFNVGAANCSVVWQQPIFVM
jgi:hypothetical protein